jgi:hypothetical protein
MVEKQTVLDYYEQTVGITPVEPAAIAQEPSAA